MKGYKQLQNNNKQQQTTMMAAISRLQALLCNHRYWRRRRRRKRRYLFVRFVLGCSACWCKLLCLGGIWMWPPAHSLVRVWWFLCSSGRAPDWGDQCLEVFAGCADPTAQPGPPDPRSWTPDWSQSSESSGSRWSQREVGQGRTATDAVKLLHYYLIANKGNGRNNNL